MVGSCIVKSTRCIRRTLKNGTEFDIAGVNDNTRIPLHIFRGVLSLHLSDTGISSKHLVQITKKSGCLQFLDVSKCPQLKDDFIFHAKNYLGELLWLDLSYNENISILELACLCSYSEIKHIQVFGMKRTPDECVFLSKTFDVTRRECQIETGDGEYLISIYHTFRTEFTLWFI